MPPAAGSRRSPERVGSSTSASTGQRANLRWNLAAPGLPACLTPRGGRTGQNVPTGQCTLSLSGPVLMTVRAAVRSSPLPILLYTRYRMCDQIVIETRAHYVHTGRNSFVRARICDRRLRVAGWLGRFRHYECPWGPAALVAGWSLAGTPSTRPADRHYCARAPVAGAQVYHRTHDRNSGCKGVRHD